MYRIALLATPGFTGNVLDHPVPDHGRDALITAPT
jgi:hypothetical protein